MKLTALAALLVACGPRVPPRPPETPLPASAWQASSSMQNDTPCAAHPKDCGNGRWQTDRIGPEMGAFGVSHVTQNATGYVIYYSGNHPCGHPSQEPHWWVELPLPVRPYEQVDETPGTPCTNQP